jgi:hypothetical protein
MLPPGLVGLFSKLTGLSWPEANEDRLRLVGLGCLSMPSPFRRLEDLFGQVVLRVREGFEGATAGALSRRWSGLLGLGGRDGRSLLALAAEQAERLVISRVIPRMRLRNPNG